MYQPGVSSCYSSLHDTSADRFVNPSCLGETAADGPVQTVPCRRSGADGPVQTVPCRRSVQTVRCRRSGADGRSTGGQLSSRYMAAMPSSKVGYLLLASVGERTPFTPPTHPPRALDHDNANPAAEQPLHHIPIFISVHFAYHDASCHRLRLPGVRRYGSAFPHVDALDDYNRPRGSGTAFVADPTR